MLAILEAVPQAAFAVEKDGTICWGNHTFRQMRGCRGDRPDARARMANGRPMAAGFDGLVLVEGPDGYRAAGYMRVTAAPGGEDLLLAVADEGRNDIFCRVDAAGLIRKAGAGLCELLAVSGPSLMGTPAGKLVAAEDRERFTRELAAAQETRAGLVTTQVRLTDGAGVAVGVTLRVVVRDEAQVARDEVFRQMPHALAMLRVSGAGECLVEMANEAFAGMAERTEEECAGRRLEELFELSLAGQLVRRCQECVAEGRRVDFSVHPGWEVTRLTWTLSLMASRQPEVGHTWILLLARNIPPEQEAMRLLEEQEELYRGVVDAQAELICRFDKAGHYLFVNAAFCRFYGTTMEELIGKRWQTYVPPSDAVEIEASFARLTPQSPFGQTNGKTANAVGEVRWLEFSNRGYFDESGNIREVLAVGRDVTERRRAEQELAERTAELDSIYQNSPSILIRFDPQRLVKSVSPSCEQTLGWKVEELLGKTTEMLDHPDDEEVRLHALRELMEGAKTARLRHRVAARNNGYRWMQTTLRKVEETIHSASIDITEQVQAEEALLRERRFHENLFATMSQGVVYHDASGALMDANPAAERILGATVAQMQERTSEDPRWEALREDGSPFPGAEHPAMVSLRTAEPVHDVPMCIRNAADGMERWINITAIPQFGEDKRRPVGVYAIFQDISPRIRALRALRDNEQMLQLALEASRSATWKWDVAGRRHWVSPVLLEMLGYASQEVTDFAGKMLPLVHPEDRAEVERFLRRLPRCGDNRQELAMRMRHRDGHYLHLAVHARAAGRQIVGTIQDVSDLVEARKRAEHHAKSRSDFLANMSHEIRTPMNGVMGMTSLLLETELRGEQRGFLESIQTSGDALLTLINDVLDLSKIEAGGLHLEEIPFEPAAVAEDAVEMLALVAKGKQLTMALRVAEEVPLELVGDPTRLRQVLLNLVSNAVKFTLSGGVEVRLARVAAGGDEVMLQVEVADTGIGITEEQKERLFEAFEQAERSTTRRFGGTGLGLAIARSLVEQMGGTIGVESESGQGSTFRFTVRLRRAGPRAAGDGTPRRVLLVEENVSRRAVLAKQIAGLGWQPVSAGQADVILLGISGTEAKAISVVEEVRREGRREPIVLLGTGLVRLQHGERWAELGIADQLLRPVRMKGLGEAVERVLDGDSRKAPAGPEAWSGRRVLVADDNRVNRDVARMMLQKLGCVVVTCKNGREAVEQEAAEPFDLLVMDCQMPLLDGLDATREIRAREGEGPRVPIVALTAGVMTDERENCFAAGMDGFLTKPVSMASMRKMLEQWLR